MANTEGISDEKLVSMLTIDPSSQSTSYSSSQKTDKAKNIHKSFLERQRMIDSFENGGDVQPSATVIRASDRNRPAVIKSSAKAKANHRGSSINYNRHQSQTSQKISFQDNDTKKVSFKDTNEYQLKNETDNQELSSFRPLSVIKSNSIKERPILLTVPQSQENIGKKVSRFKTRQMKINDNDDTTDAIPTPIENKTLSMHTSGFPSFDLPVGSLTRKGIVESNNYNNSDNTHITKGKKACIKNSNTITKRTIDTMENTTVSQADSILANMTTEQIKESVAEIESILSPEMIQFLKNRKKEKLTSSSSSKEEKEEDTYSNNNHNERNNIQKVPKSNNLNNTIISMEEKERIGKVLANIKSEEELDEVFTRTMGIWEEDKVLLEDESELEVATKLLRSTAPRQRTLGAKTITGILENRLLHLMTENKTSLEKGQLESNKSYPTLLPVALRCLLDLPSPEKHSLLFTYLLRSIYTLALLFSNRANHAFLLYVGSKEPLYDMPSICQLYGLNDYVSIPPASYLYSTKSLIEKRGTNQQDLIGCYSTDSSAESAEKDGEAFYSDPLWTLLSRMRILPCIAHILSASSFHKKDLDNNLVLPVESINAICGVLSMLSLRSPGAACAIAQHKSIIPSMIGITLELDDYVVVEKNNKEHSDEDYVVNTKLALPMIRLICTLCRQSRTIATSAWMNDVMENILVILATEVRNESEWELQKWCIILWRSLLRYGLGLSYTQTILSLSITHLSTQDETEYSLSSYYLTSFAVLCDCIEAVGSYNKNSTENLITDETDNEVLSSSCLSFVSHAKSCINFLESYEYRHGMDKILSMRLATSRISLLTSYTTAVDAMKKVNDSNNNIPQIPIISRNAHVRALLGIYKSPLLHDAINIVLNQSDQNSKTIDINNYKLKTTACSFVYTFFTALSRLLRRADGEGKMKEEEEEEVLGPMVNNIFNHILQLFQAHVHVSHYNIESSCLKSLQNKALFAVARMMVMTLSINQSTLGIEANQLSLLQSFVFSLIGMFDLGEESLLAILVSQSIIFEVIIDRSTHSVRHIQEILLREIMATSPQSQVQLEHSVKLHGFNEMTSYAGGPFQLESLRMEAERSEKTQGIIPQTSNNISHEVISLPLGADWLFKLLCGTIDLGDNPEHKVSRLQNTSNIVIAALRLILYMEKQNTTYAKSLSCGCKCYFLLNVCLFPEEIVRQDCISNLFHNLFDLYNAPNKNEEDEENAKSFILSCFKHSFHQSSNGVSIRQKVENSISDDQVLEFFYGTKISSSTKNESNEEKKMISSPKYFKAIDDFISDICTAFADYGAQYDFFCISIRFLLMPGFPSRNRVIVLNRLKDLLHLLTTEKESMDNNLLNESIVQALSKSFGGGLSIRDGSKRDSAELLDTLASLLSNTKYETVEGGGFFYLYTVGYLARNLASSSIKCECGLNAMKRRLKGMKQEVLDDIITVSFLLMKDMIATKERLVQIVLKTCLSLDAREKYRYKWEELSFDNEVWDKMIMDLKKEYTT